MFRAVLDRESRTVSSRRLHRRVSAESDLVQRLERQTLLEGHTGCVNTAVSWTNETRTPVSERVLCSNVHHISIHT